MARGMLVFKGEDPKKKKKKSKHSKKKAQETTTIEDNAPGPEYSASLSSRNVPAGGVSSSGSQSAASSSRLQSAAPKINTGTGEITTSGTVVTGLGTQFEKEISTGDAIIVMIDGQQQMRVVTMRLSNTSLNLSSGFSENLKNPMSFSIVGKPRDEAKQRQLKQQEEYLNKKQEEQKASGTYGSTDELVYRERTETGNYRIRRQKIEGEGVSRADLLDIRSKKTSDKYC